MENIDMSRKSVLPSIKETAFDCPHCGAYTTQYWFGTYAQEKDDNRTPNIYDKEMISRVQQATDIPENIKNNFFDTYARQKTGLVFLRKLDNSQYARYDVENLHLSKCYNCGKVAVWVHSNLLFPGKKSGAAPNNDLPDDIIRDFEEARSIINESPRGAAALLRLCIQKLCKHLGENGKTIDEDIGSLVAKGLNPIIQRSLDIVRVIGNEAVHPGELDLRDDRDIANRLLDIVNSIADQMITHPKKVEELYGKLPESKRKAIEKRDAK
jgi:hypothetical protein